jgi:hypothetical protein
VYKLYENNDGETEWFWEGYGHAKRKKQTMPIVIATEAGPPPDDWRPECGK